MGPQKRIQQMGDLVQRMQSRRAPIVKWGFKNPLQI